MRATVNLVFHHHFGSFSPFIMFSFLALRFKVRVVQLYRSPHSLTTPFQNVAGSVVAIFEWLQNALFLVSISVAHY